MKITKINVRKILDSRKDETLETEIFSDNIIGKASVPQGKSKGEREAISLPANEALKNTQDTIGPNIINQEFSSQEAFDEFLIKLDGTQNKSRLGANAILALSLSFARAFAQTQNQPLYQYLQNCLGINERPQEMPRLYMNIIEGGAHAKNKSLDFQEYLIVVRSKDTNEALEIGKAIFNKTGPYLEATLGIAPEKGDEGGYDAVFKDYNEPLEILNEIIRILSYQTQAKLALDVAANHFAASEESFFYQLAQRRIDSDGLLGVYNLLLQRYPLISLEDPFAEKDIKSYATLNKYAGLYPFVIGDDLTATNPLLIQGAIDAGAIDGVIVKPNQIGSLSETFDAIRLARNNNLKIIVSHRSGETEDNFIADLAYACGAFGLKAGAPEPRERLAKYERLAAIEAEARGTKI